MKTLLLLLVLLLNAVFLFVAGLATVSGDVAMPGRLCAVLVVVALAGSTALLLAVRAGRLPIWGLIAMRHLSFAVPALWLLGSLTSGRLSAQDAVFLVVVSLLAWGTWRVFRSLQTHS